MIESKVGVTEIMMDYFTARRLHFDNNPGDEGAKDKFQKLGEAYQVKFGPPADEKQNQGHPGEGSGDWKDVSGMHTSMGEAGSDSLNHLQRSCHA